MKRLRQILSTAIVTILLFNATIYYFPELYPYRARVVYAQATMMDPCQWNGIAKKSFTKTITTATTTVLFTVSSVGRRAILCGYDISTGSTITANTWNIVSGIQVTNPCDTTQVALSGPLNTSGVLTGVFHFGYAGAAEYSVAGSNGNSNQICLISTVGTGPSIVITGTYSDDN